MMKILIVCSGKPSNPQWSFELTRSYVYEQIESIRNLNLGIEYDTYFIEGNGISGYLKNYKSMVQKIKLYQPDIIHAHYGLSGLLASLQRKLPVITTFHGSDINVKKNRPFSYLASKLSKENIFVHKNQPSKINYANHINLIPCGVDTKLFYPIDKKEARQILQLDLDKKYVLFTGTFNNKVKNYPLAKEAIENSTYEIELLELKGYTRKEVCLLMNAVDALIITSFSETGPIVAKEAMCCNCPIVSVDVGDVRDVVATTTGCFVTSYDAVELAHAMNDVFKLNKKTEGIHKMKKYSLDRIANQVLQVYKKVINDDN